jgi:hypothetical protein
VIGQIEFQYITGNPPDTVGIRAEARLRNRGRGVRRADP